MRFGTPQNSLTVKLLPGGTLELETEDSYGYFDCYRSRILIEPERVLKILAMLNEKSDAIRAAIDAESNASAE